MTRREALAFGVLVALGLASIVWYAQFWFRSEHIPTNWPELGSVGVIFNTLLFIVLTFVVWRGLITHVFHWWLVPSMVRPVPMAAPAGLRVALMTCYVPGKEPIDLLERSLRAMVDVRYPHDTWVLDEGDDPDVRALCARLGVRHFSRRNRPEYNRHDGPFLAKTKAGNHNAWHDRYGADYDVVGQMDMDYICRPDLFEKTLGYFRDPEVGFVGGPQIYANHKESMIARGSAEQAYGFYGALQMANAGKGFQLFIGTVHVVRTEALRSIGGYAGHIVEDHLTGMRLYAKGWKSVYVPEVLAEGEGPTTFTDYFAQQMRWAYGSIDIMLRHLPRHWRQLPTAAKVGYPLYESFYLFGIGQFLGIALTSVFFTLGWAAASVDLPMWILHAAPPFVLSWVIFYWLQRFHLRRDERGLHLSGHILMQAAWPVATLAFLQAALGRKLHYAVTAKGSAASGKENFPFKIHLVMAVISAVGLGALVVVDRGAPHLVAWALFSVVTMASLPLAWKLIALRRRAETDMVARGRPTERPIAVPVDLSLQTLAQRSAVATVKQDASVRSR